MMLSGKIEKVGKWWSAEVAAAGVFTQGTSFDDAMSMLAEAVELTIEREDVTVTVTRFGDAGDVLVWASDPAALAAHVLKYQREVHGLSLSEVAKALGVKSKTGFARYEQGLVVPTIDKFSELLKAVAPEMSVVLMPTDRLTQVLKLRVTKIKAVDGNEKRVIRYVGGPSQSRAAEAGTKPRTVNPASERKSSGKGGKGIDRRKHVR